MESSLRLRLVFEDRKILSDSQRSCGLKRSWVLVNQSNETISELSDYLIHSFDLRDSCPDGLVLSIDGFVLPSFESTSILKENDIIRVKKKRSYSDIARVDNERKCFEHVNGDVKFLAIEEFENESGGYRSESEEGEPENLEDIEDTPKKKTISMKRKASKKLDRSNDRKKRRKSDTKEESPGIPEDVHIKIESEQNRSSCQDVLLLKSPAENVKSSDTQNEVAYSSNSDFDERKKSEPSQKRSDQLQENGKSNGLFSPLPDGTKKFPSRSTRRRKLKRQWLREQKLKGKEMQSSITDNQQPWRDKGKSAKENQQPNACKLVKDRPQPEECDDEEEGDIVPVVVRPGHIRFEPYVKEDAGHTTQQHETLVENFQWNGITNKRKGQKWGTEKAGSYKRSDQENLNLESSYIPVVEEQTAIDFPVDFDKLRPCTALPEVGDTVAYRLIELSSSWTPELSPFRVGKISKLDINSDRITLVQVPEYPIAFEKDGDEDEESAAKSNMSLYAEDGSLEIDYPSLVDCRIMKHSNSSAPKPVSRIISRAIAGNQGASSSLSKWPNSNDEPKAHKPNTEGASSSWSSWPNSSKKEPKSKNCNTGGASSSWSSWPSSDKDPKAKNPNATSQENGKVNSWEEICDTLSAKKAELAKEGGWTKNASTSQSSWAYRALRGSAMGPTMARLRAQNEI